MEKTICHTTADRQYAGFKPEWLSLPLNSVEISM